MPKQQLFRAYADDLQNACPDAKGVFLCPICFRVFSFDKLGDDLDEMLSIGHVWPKHLRKRSDKAKKQKVLLCTKCNSKAGYRGDSMMQIITQVQEEEKAGKHYEARRMQVTSTRGFQEVANLEAFVEQLGEKRIWLSFPRYRKESQRHHFEKELRKFYEYAAQEPVNITVYARGGKPNNPFGNVINWPLAQVGWLTSAYLLAFYTFGYRYILDKNLNPVREYIVDSFRNREKKESGLPKSGVPSVRVCDIHNYKDSEIGLVVPVDRKTPAYLQVSFLNYHVNLPFACVPSVIESMIFLKMPDIENKIPEMIEGDFSLYIPIGCSKSDGHDCIWDYILGKPIPML